MIFAHLRKQVSKQIFYFSNENENVMLCSLEREEKKPSFSKAEKIKRAKFTCDWMFSKANQNQRLKKIFFREVIHYKNPTCSLFLHFCVLGKQNQLANKYKDLKKCILTLKK